MSSLDSDPWFGRGQTLGVNSTDQSSHIPGTHRWFTDTNPVTGAVNSNAPVKCIAVRNTSAGTLAPGAVVKFATGSLGNVDGAATADILMVGIVDEYLTSNVAINDIFWLVVAGPTTANTTGTITAGGGVSVGAGVLGAHVAGKTAGVALTAATANKARVLVGHQDYNIRVSLPA